MRAQTVAACLIAQNEQERLADALLSVEFCDETIVVDGGSSDATVALASSRGACVIENPWPGFSRQRNIAIDAAHGDWILEIDADERVSPTLRASIEKLLEQPPADRSIAVFALRNRFLGRPLERSAKYPAYRSRMFRRGAYRHDESRSVHEGIVPRERPIVLEGDLEHILADTVPEALRDMWRYARLESAHLAPTGLAGYVRGIVLRPLAKLVYRIGLEAGWRDGWQGMVKILLDAASDAIVWTMVLLREGSAQSDAPRSSAGHFGRRSAGPPKIVAVAGDRASAERAARWLSLLRQHGVDVALLSRAADTEPDLPQQPLRSLRPASLRHTVDMEMDLRSIDALVPFGLKACIACRLLPPMLRPAILGIDSSVEPSRVVELANAATQTA